MSYSIAAPFSYFVGSDGYALESGYVYFGTENLNAETNPVTVYWDAALTIPAAQPIRTRNGLPYRNGSPANVFVASSVSVIVKDKNGVMIAPFWSKEEAESARVKYGYGDDNYYVDKLQ